MAAAVNAGVMMTRQWSVFAVVILSGVGLLGPSSARAHAFLDHAEPRVGSTVNTAPAVMSLTFTEPVESGFCRVEVRDAHGQKVSAGALEHPQPETLRLPLPPLPRGDYTVQWAVTSVDTHQTKGSFDFTVSAP
jgi:methionine-rich copper-binding protein CopC